MQDFCDNCENLCSEVEKFLDKEYKLCLYPYDTEVVPIIFKLQKGYITPNWCYKRKENKFVKLENLLKIKGEAYGDAYKMNEDFLKLLYPKGIAVEDYKNISALCRIFEKMVRIANRHYVDSWEDIAGYAMLKVE